MTLLARLIAKEEGFGVPGAIPTTHNNPGDLEHAPGETHDGKCPIGSFASVAAGWAMLERQLQLEADRGLTIEQLIYCYAPPSQNNSAAYLQHVCAGLGLPYSTPVSEALKLP
jgi:hypothetical protein